MPANNFTLELARQCAERGWPVFPCHNETKRPLVERGVKAATRDVDQITKWFSTWPGAMIGIRCGRESGLLVIDCDKANGIDGVAELTKLLGEIPETITVRTPRGGLHLYFQYPDNGTEISNSAGKLAPGIDVRAEGGYVIAAGSQRADQVFYETMVAMPDPAPVPRQLLDLLAAAKPETKPEAKPETKPETTPPVPATDPVLATLAAAAARHRKASGNGNGYGAAALENECRKLATAPPGQRNHALNAAAFSLGQLVAGGVLNEGEVRLRLRDACMTNGLIKDDGAASVAATLNSGLAAGMQKPRTPPEREELPATAPTLPPPVPAPAITSAPPTKPALEPPPPLPWINYANWDNEPVPRQEWAVLDRIPLRQCALFTGEGGAGKSIATLHLCSAHPLGRDWLGSVPELGPAIFIDAEDEQNVLHYRLANIARHYGVKFVDLLGGGLHLMSLVGKDALLATVSRSGKVEPTTLYGQVLEAAADIGPKLIGVASVSNVFAGDENSRNQVQQFVGLMTRVAIVANGSVVLISHPSLTGINSDTGLSGSTQWHNAVRARFYLKGVAPESGEQPDDDLREIVFKKNQYGPKSETIALRYDPDKGLFLPLPGATSLDKLAREAKADEVFLTLLAKLARRNETTSSKPTAHNYAPTVFAGEAEAKAASLKKADFKEAMKRLFDADKVHLEQYGSRSKETWKLVAGPRPIEKDADA